MLEMFLEAVFGLFCAALGAGVMFLLFGKKIDFVDGHGLLRWGVRKNPNGKIEMHSELLTLVGLLIVFAGFGFWAFWKAI